MNSIGDGGNPVVDVTKVSILDIKTKLFGDRKDVFYEKRICDEQCAADAIFFRADEMYGIEVKSDFDDDFRLHRQINFYSRTFDYCYIVCGQDYFEKYDVKRVLPSHWGYKVMRKVNGKVKIVDEKKAKLNLGVEIKNVVNMANKLDISILLDEKRNYEDTKKSVYGNLLIKKYGKPRAKSLILAKLKKKWTKQNKET